MTMRVVHLVTENFKRIRVVDITPEGNIVTIGGKNGSGKTSVLDAIYVALIGRAANPPRPVRAGEEKATIKLDLGDFLITRTFTVKAGDKYTDTVKVETADGLRYGEPQKVLNALLGEIGFDPFDFMQKKPKEQAEMLLQMVPLPVDLDEMAELDTSDFAKRRDVNRDADALQARLNGIPKEEVPEDVPDRAELTAKLASAADTNGKIDAERRDREDTARAARQRRQHGDELRDTAASRRAEAARLIEDAERLEASAGADDADADRLEKELAALPALDEPVNTEDLRRQLTEADAVLAAIERQRQRVELAEQLAAKQAESTGYTEAMAARAKQRQDALAKAKMPIDGLGFSIDEQGKAYVTWEGLPFVEDQISTAVQLRVSTKIAMAANPKLRVLRIKDGSLLDEDAMKMLAEMAAAEDYQLWIEVVRADGGVGFIMEDGAVKAQPEPEGDAAPAKKATGKKAAGKAEAGKLDL
jgi:DNA repair exonuclease SbcCD ATPase subunit